MTQPCEIVQLGAKILRQHAEIVEHVGSPDIRQIITDMQAALAATQGVGLAAPQLGEPLRACVVEVESHLYELVNPAIVRSDGDDRDLEGCLSIPEYYAEVERPASIRVRALDRDGREREVTAEGLLATVLQHEIDHLDGVLFIDHISKLKRDRVIKKFQKASKRSGDGAHVL